MGRHGKDDNTLLDAAGSQKCRKCQLRQVKGGSISHFFDGQSGHHFDSSLAQRRGQDPLTQQFSVANLCCTTCYYEVNIRVACPDRTGANGSVPGDLGRIVRESRPTSESPYGSPCCRMLTAIWARPWLVDLPIRALQRHTSPCKYQLPHRYVWKSFVHGSSSQS